MRIADADQLEGFLESRESGFVLERPDSVADIPAGVFLVYILTIDDHAVIIGHGKKNRARVIFDSPSATTTNHFKAMTVRLYSLFGHDGAVFNRYFIRCANKLEAKELEAALHRNKFGGNTPSVPDPIREALFHGLPEDSLVRMVLRMALCSSFDVIADLNRWRREGILDGQLWAQITEILKLPRDKDRV